jgi:hypothetical protein
MMEKGGSTFQPLMTNNNSNLQWVFNVLIEKIWLLRLLIKLGCYFLTTWIFFQFFFCFFSAGDWILVTKFQPRCG